MASKPSNPSKPSKPSSLSASQKPATDVTAVKDLVHQYYVAQKNGRKAAQLRKQLIPLLKKAGMTGTRFEFPDTVISYLSYNKPGNITQKLIKDVVLKYYPSINAEQFIKTLLAARVKRTIETVECTHTDESGSKQSRTSRSRMGSSGSVTDDDGD